MKKGTKICLLVGILLLALGLTITQIAHHRGESFNAAGWSFGSVGSVGSLNYDEKGYTVCTDGEERFPAKEVRELKLSWLSGSVSVERYDGRELVVRETASVSLREDECLRYKLSGGTLSILPCANKVGRLPEKQLTVLVPQSLTLSDLEADVSSASVTVRDLALDGAIRADSASGSLRVEDCRCAALELNSSSGSQHVLRTEVSGGVNADGASGSFTAEALRCGSLDVESGSGSKRIDELSCDTLRISSVSGSVRVSGLRCGKAAVSSTSGSVELAFSAAPERVDVESTSGSVTLAFPKGTGIDLDYDRTSGSLHGDVLYGDLPVNVDTTSGSLTIRYGE